LRSFVSNDNDVAGIDVTVGQRVHRSTLAFRKRGLGVECGRIETGGLDDSTFGRERAVKNRDPQLRGSGIEVSKNFAIGVQLVGRVLRHRLACDGERVTVHVSPGVNESFHQNR